MGMASRGLLALEDTTYCFHCFATAGAMPVQLFQKRARLRLLLQVEAGKDAGKSHSWVDGNEVEADRWVNTADAAALDAWGREASPEPTSRGTAELQALGECAHHI